MKKIVIAAGLTLALAGCGPQMVWVKPGATQQDFNVDNYGCEKDARQSGYFGTGLMGAINMQNFFKECMGAHGWHEEQRQAQSTIGERMVSCHVDGRDKFLMESQCRSAGGVPQVSNDEGSCAVSTTATPICRRARA